MSEAGQKSELSKSDRMELRRVVKSRFELLKEQMETRAREIHHLAKAQIQKDHKPTIKEGEKRGKEMAKKLEASIDQAEALVREMRIKGVEPCDTTDFDYYAKRLIKSLRGEWEIVDLKDQINTLINAINDEHGHSKINLEQQKLQLLETLSLDALESDKAKKFLSEIPKVDDFMPLPKGSDLKQLTA